jgi:hypothetical protein
MGAMVQINLVSPTRSQPVILAGTCVRTRPVDDERFEAGFLLED